jgi:hypothetical protein
LAKARVPRYGTALSRDLSLKFTVNHVFFVQVKSSKVEKAEMPKAATPQSSPSAETAVPPRSPVRRLDVRDPATMTAKEKRAKELVCLPAPFVYSKLPS